MKQHDKTNSNFNNLVCLQYISNAEITKIDNAKAKPISQPIWVAKFSPDNKFLATGGSDTVLKVFKLSLVSENEEDYEIGLQLLDSNYIALQKHTFDIIDISWYKVYNLVSKLNNRILQEF